MVFKNTFSLDTLFLNDFMYVFILIKDFEHRDGEECPRLKMIANLPLEDNSKHLKQQVPSSSLKGDTAEKTTDDPSGQAWNPGIDHIGGTHFQRKDCSE